MGLYRELDSFDLTDPQEGLLIHYKDFDNNMMRENGQPSPPPVSQSSSATSTPPTTPISPGTPGRTTLTAGNPLTPSTALTLPSTVTNPSRVPRESLPSLTESDSLSSSAQALSDTTSDSQSDAASVCSSTTEWTNFDISPLIKEELKQAIVARRKTHGLPDMEIDFNPKPSSELTPEEEVRRRQQKERNRSAAAKCRSKKRHAVARLVDEAQELETANEQLRQEMKTLETERTKLQFLLDMHSPQCLKQSTSSTVTSPQPFLPKRNRVTTPVHQVMHSPTLSDGTSTSIAGVAATLQSLPSTPSLETAPGFASPSYMPPTPSTTYSQSSTGQTSPTLLTPTSAPEAPTFPIMSATPQSAPTSGMALQGAPAEHGIVYTASGLVVPQAPSLATLDKPTSNNTLTDAVNMLSSIFEGGDSAFPPMLPPTPDVDEDDPLSASFVKQYLGDDALEVSDLSLPISVDNSSFPESSFTMAQNVAQTNLGCGSAMGHESSQGMGPSSVNGLHAAGFPFSRIDLPFTQPQAAMNNHLSNDNYLLASRDQMHGVHTNTHHSSGVYCGVVSPPSAAPAVASPTLSGNSCSPSESHLTLSFSAILGLPFEDADPSGEPQGAGMTHQTLTQSAIFGNHQMQRGSMHSAGSFEFDVDVQNTSNLLTTGGDGRSNTS